MSNYNYRRQLQPVDQTACSGLQIKSEQRFVVVVETADSTREDMDRMWFRVRNRGMMVPVVIPHCGPTMQWTWPDGPVAHLQKS